MAISTITLAQTIAWAQCFLRFPSLTIGSNNEPAITSANVVLQTICGAPFHWNWNRFNHDSIPIVTQVAVVTITGTIPSIIEKSELFNPATSESFELEVKDLIGVTGVNAGEIGRPAFVSLAQIDSSGNQTVGLSPTPDTSYTLNITGQAVAPLITATTSTWAPVPDWFAYLYNYGFLALMLAYWNDARFPIFNQKFIASILAAQRGLSEVEKNLFLGNWLATSEQVQAGALSIQQGTQARGV